MRWEFAEKFGWTLDYIDSLSLAEIEQYYEVIDGKGKAMSYLQRKMGALNQAKGKSGRHKRR